jgi:hypothetical protein
MLIFREGKMKGRIILYGGLFFCLLIASKLYGEWISYDPEKKYDEVCFLTSHNSYAATEHGFLYAQQTLSLKKQLELGVRGLMLDIFDDPKEKIVLCHGGHFITRLICMGKKPMPFKKSLITIREFLNAHPSEIITIFLENYVTNNELLDAVLKESDVEDLILSPSDWDPSKGWPYLGWMQTHNKRLVIFNAQGRSRFTFNEWEHVIENRWGTLHTNHALKERKESKAYRHSRRHLLLLNYFPKLQLNVMNSYENINSKMLDVFMQKTLAHGLKTHSSKHRLPNFICLDQIHTGNGMKHVIAINSKHR